MNTPTRAPSQPFLLGVPCSPAWSIDALASLCAAYTDPTGASTIADGTTNLQVSLPANDGTAPLMVNLISQNDFQAAAGDNTKSFAGSGQLWTTIAQLSEVLAFYRGWLNDQPSLGNGISYAQNAMDPTNFEVVIAFQDIAQGQA